jgi:hypothetical protein
VAELFQEAGWQVEVQPKLGVHRPDLLVRKGKHAYVVEIKTASEGRRDRVVPLLSEAILRAKAYARAKPGLKPLAIVSASDLPERLLDQLGAFAREYAPDVAIGVVGWDGARRFVGGGLDSMNSERAVGPLLRGAAARRPGRVPHKFSDLNQWMLKVLLAPEIPERLLAAPRDRYRNASQLAAAASVSVMSAFRFVQQLRAEGFCDESSRGLELVRREELFRQWQGHAQQPVREVAMRFLVRGDANRQIKNLLQDGHGCLGLFAAADALKLGFVHGVPPYVYAKRLEPSDLAVMKGLVPASPGESPDVILREAAAPQSVFRAAVRAGGMLVSDVVQIWLDVSGHPSRGKEQAALIDRKVLRAVIRGEAHE